MSFNLDPSAAERWGPGGCPASAGMESRYPDVGDSPGRAEGTAACWYMTEALHGRPPIVGSNAPNGQVVTEEMAECAIDILRDIRSTINNCGTKRTLGIEEPLAASRSVHEWNKGRPDVFVIDWGNRRLHLWEYKFGHRYVDAFRNWQCLNYVAMIMETHAIPEAQWPQWRVTITIAQPRNYHPDGSLREWFFDGVELEGYVARLRVAATLAAGPCVPDFIVGSQCDFCSARHACGALQRDAAALADRAYQSQPIDLPADALGLELRFMRSAIKRMEARAEGLEAHAVALAKSGIDVAHWRLEYSKGREKWREDVSTAEVLSLGELFGVDLAQPVKPITPGQARKAGMDPEAIKGFAHKPRGALTLVPFDDKDVAKRFT